MALMHVFDRHCDNDHNRANNKGFDNKMLSKGFFSYSCPYIWTAHVTIL